MTDHRIIDLTITPIAFSDPPLLNSTGVHEPLALRTIVQLELANGVHAVGEGRAGAIGADAGAAVRDAVIGQDVFATTRIGAAVADAIRTVQPGAGRHAQLSAVAPIEVACLDAQGRTAGVPVSDLLGGAVRDSVPYSAYLFYKWAGHLDAEADAWGEALDPDGIVRQAERLVDEYGFGSLKLKAGVFEPDVEMDTIRALAQEFPGLPLRIDPNGAWTHETALRVIAEIGDLLEYVEDPVLGIEPMGRIHAETGAELATNMCLVEAEHVRPASEHRAVQILLTDHHYWGGLRVTKELGAICDALGMGVSMHSNSHLGISLAAMTHVAAAVPNLAYACDTHWPWNRVDDIVPRGQLEIHDGSLTVPTRPGLGVDLDADKVAELHERYVASGRTRRDDTGYMRRVDPAYDPTLPRF
ncbi:glucarate dehydratase [Ruania alkalisoli]|uniref:glucarate dehydratase n=1 Tax=Ruania alkalisoli TaxID=2779775 RepID=A0A7M1SVP3_9MICO|nr:enolase C-terminal domain-like protein [Ruania alkalisoli]QOR71639.1 glucarate dehydratase [Ruania alkalisoli]